MTPPLRMLLAAPLVLVSTLVCALAWPNALPDAVPSAPPGGPVAVAATVDPAVEVLRGWDERRAAAWEAGDATTLRSLYAAPSRTGRADLTLLSAYAARGVDVSALEVQYLAVTVERAGPDRVVVVVTDRLARVEASRAGEPVSLPSDAASTHRVVLVREGGTWLVEEAYPARQPAR